ncbi:hypothetical protein ACFP81_12270 [Deinococcus lacus]|uniref:Uncharacterized protein n=1 Tax=Deinococcus lacus TaxID=392561 RepID=A0ABW1YGL7_9DEIO
MTRPAHLSTLSPLPVPAAQGRAVCLAAEAVLAGLCGRAPTRLERVSLDAGNVYALEPDPAALQANRPLLEDLVMVALAAGVAAEWVGGGVPAQTRCPQELLRWGLTEPDEQAVCAEYLEVLRARTRAALRRAWPEVLVVAVGLAEHGTLLAAEVAHRAGCARRIRATTLN